MRARSRFTALIAIGAMLAVGCQSAAPSPSGSAPLGSDAPAGSALPPMADVLFYRGNPTANSVHPGPGPTGEPELAWRNADVGEMHMVPILVDGLLIVGTNDGRVVALDALSGEVRWSYQADGPIQPSLASADGIVFASDTTALHAIDVATGDKRWVTPVDGATGRLNVADGVAYVGKTGGVVGLDPISGEVVWEWEGPPDTPVNAGPVADGVGYFAGRDGRVYAIDLADRHELWRQQTISLDVASGQVLGDTFFVSTNQGEAADPAGEIYAIDRASGEVRWRFRAPSGVQLKEGPVKDGVLFANGRQDGIYALRDEGDRATVVWHVNTPESHWPMALVDDTLYEVRVDGSLGAYAMSDGTLLWETDPEGDWAGGPIVSGGMVFVNNDSGAVTAFADPALIAQLPEPAAEASPEPSSSSSPASNPFTIVRAFSSGMTGITEPLGMDAGPDALLYVLDTKPEVTVLDPSDGHVVRRWGRQGAGPGEFDVRRADDNPGNGDITVAPDGRVYVADGSNHRVQVFTPEGEFLFQFGSFGPGEGQFVALQEIEVGPDGEVYIRDTDSFDKYTADGKFAWRSQDPIYYFAVRSDGSIVASCEPCRELLLVDPADGRITERWEAPAMDGDPLGVVNVDSQDNIYMHVFGSDSQLVFDAEGTFVGRMVQTTVGNVAAPVFLPDGRGYLFTEDGLEELRVQLPAASSRNPFDVVRAFPWDETGIGTPLGMDPGPDGLLYVFDAEPHVTVIDPSDGRVVHRWGRQGAGPGEFDVSRVDNNPGNGDVAVAQDGRIYVADGSNHRVQIFSSKGEFLSQFGSFGTEPGQFGAIQEITVAPDGSIYVGDGHVSKFTADGKFVWQSTENLHHFAVRRDGDVISVCELCRQLLHVSQKDGHIVERWDTPQMDGDGFGPVNIDPNGNIYVETYTAESMLIFDPHGRFIAGSYLQPGMRRMEVGKKIEWGDWYGPTPVFLPDGRAFTFAERGLVELKVTLPT
jgi:outer membrane protein assembly factor BamB